MNGERLRRMLEERNITQTQFAARIGVTKASVCAIIAEKQVPSLALAALMARELGVTIDELIRE